MTTARWLGAAYAAAAGVVVLVRSTTGLTVWDLSGALLAAAPVVLLVVAASLPAKDAAGVRTPRRGAGQFGFAMVLLMAGVIAVPASGIRLIGVWTLLATSVFLAAAYFRILAGRGVPARIRTATWVTALPAALLGILYYHVFQARLRSERPCSAGRVADHCGNVHDVGDTFTLDFFVECFVLCTFGAAFALDLLVGLGLLMLDIGANSVFVLGGSWGADGDVAAAIMLYAGLGWAGLPWLTSRAWDVSGEGVGPAEELG